MSRRSHLPWISCGLLWLIAAFLQRRTGGLEAGLLVLCPLLWGYLSSGPRTEAGRWEIAAIAAAVSLVGALFVYPVPAWALGCAVLASSLRVQQDPPLVLPILKWAALIPVGLSWGLDWRAGAASTVVWLALAAGSFGGSRLVACSGFALGAGVSATTRHQAWADFLLLALVALALQRLLPELRRQRGWRRSLSALAAIALIVLTYPSLLGAIGHLPGPEQLWWFGLSTLGVICLALKAPKRELGVDVERTLQILCVAAGLVALVFVGDWCIQARAHVGGVDFYYYVCLARDRIAVPEQVPLAQYGYSPGSYWLWEIVLRFGDSLASLQRGWLALLLLVSGLTSLAVWRIGRAWQWALLAFLWCFRLLSQFDGLEACNEPWVALWGVLALVVWCGQPLGGDRRGAARALGVGLCLGFSVFCKQQGVLLAGASVFFVVAPALDRRYSWRSAVWGGVGLGVGYLVPVLSEGHGFVPVSRAFGVATSYQAKGSWPDNLWAQAQHDPTLLIGLGLVLVGVFYVLAPLLKARRPRELLPPEAGVLFAALIWALTLAQFQKRGYAHYTQLGAPFLVCAACLAGVLLARSPVTRRAGRFSTVAGGLWFGALVLFLPAPGDRVQFSPTDYGFESRRSWRADAREELLRLAETVAPGSELLVLPPGKNEIHFLLGTRALVTPINYGFGYEAPLPPPDMYPWKGTDGVLVFLRREDRGEIWEYSRCQELLTALPGKGFTRVYASPLMEFWRRPPP